MKNVIILLFFTLIFQSTLKAEDISDFEIEGMSVGDSALDYFNKSKIMSGKTVTYPGDDSFYGKQVVANDGTYQEYSFTFKKNDNNFLIYQLKGMIFIQFNECLKKKKTVVSDIKKVLQNVKENSYRADYNKMYGKSVAEVTDLEVEGGFIRIWCDNFDKNFELSKNWDDSLSVDASNDEYLFWLNNKAYK